jgi:hypothetical protein
MQREVVDTRAIWQTPEQLGSAIFEWIEAWYNPRRHTALAMLSPVLRTRLAAAGFGCPHTAANARHDHHTIPIRSIRQRYLHGTSAEASPGSAVIT